jgi:NADH-quinone oxidoreductase subunit H
VQPLLQLLNYQLVSLELSIVKLVCLLVAIAYYTLGERKVMGASQRRFGPTVVGPFGLLQPLADGLKLAAKEFIIPTHANSRIFLGAAMMTLILALTA